MLGWRLPLLLGLVLFVGASKRSRHTRRQTHQHLNDAGQEVQITIYPTESQVRDGKDVSFDCRARTADNSVYPQVRWTRVGGPLPPNAHESSGRLTINPVSQSDSGRYVCVATHNGRTVEATANLNVLSYGPQELQGILPTSGSCMQDEKQCGNNECVKNDYVCDGEPDCRDRSDEQNCPAMRQCEPNEFRCRNQRCVQKMWLCDGDDDCGDGSDEQNCGESNAGDVCKKTEYKCGDGRQCVPSSFHCDGTNDCRDGSDEVGCVQPTVVEPPETSKTVPAGSTFKLTCKAVSVPEPYINWRLNWGPVCEPPRCLQTSEGGVGVLTVNDAQPIDQGAYTCEAINVKGRVLATPDCIVRIVDSPHPQPPPPRPPPQPTARCNVQGAVSPYPDSRGQCSCKPQVTGPNCDQCRPGSFHLSEKSPQGCLKCFCFGVTDQCQSSNLYRTKEELLFAGDAEGVTLSDIEERNIDYNPQFEYSKPGFLTYNAECHEKYWRLPQRFLGNKVTAYGGKMEFEVDYQGSGQFTPDPMVVLKGNQIILVHRVPNQDHVLRENHPNKITIETYENNWEQLNGAPATREDLMMVLADLDAFLIRAHHVEEQYSTSLGRVSWEVATERYTNDGRALEVEQCSCPPGYSGTSCEDCAPGYERSGNGPYLGTCVPVQQQRGPTCGPGAVSPQGQGGRCQCKASTTGPNCDQCAANSFHLAPTNPQGCIPCFCMGVTNQCQSSHYQRTKVAIDYGRGDRDPLALTTSDVRAPFSPQEQPRVSGSEIQFAAFSEASGQTLYWKLPEKFLGNKVTAYGGTLKYVYRYDGNGRTTPEADVIIRGNDISLQYKHSAQPQAGSDNSVELKIFEDKWQRVDGQPATREHLLMALADLDSLLIKASPVDDCSSSSLLSVNFEYAEPYGNTGLTAAEVEQCVCPPGYIGTSCEDCAPGYSRTGGGLYLGLCEKCECHGHASQCDKEYGFCVDCQHNTEGDQCERCKPGFVGDARRGTPNDCQPAATRPPCQCNNHSPRGCDSFGRCLLCEHSTEGTHCERCKKGYYGDATKGTPFDCTPCPCPGSSDCFLDSQGQVSCRICPAGLTGRLCNECAPGYTRNTKQDGRQCIPIGDVKADRVEFIPSPDVLRVQIGEPKNQYVHPGSRVTWTCQVVGYRPTEPVHFEWQRVGHANLPLGSHDDNHGHLVLENIQEEDVGMYRCTATTSTRYATDQANLKLIPPTESNRPPQPMVDPANQEVNEGDPAQFRCWVPGIPDCQISWHKEYVGGPLPHGVYQTGNALKIPHAQQKDSGNYICSAVTQYGIGKSPEARLDVKRPPATFPPPTAPPPPPPLPQQTRPPRPSGRKCDTRPRQPPPAPQRLPPTTPAPYYPPPVDCADPAATPPPPPPPRNCGPNRRPPQPQQKCAYDLTIRPRVDPIEQTVKEGEPARYRCWVPGNNQVHLKWTRLGGAPLPHSVQENSGILHIPKASQQEAGQYICTATDPRDNQPNLSDPVTLRVLPPSEPSPVVGPQVEPAEQTVNEGDPAQFRCWVPGNPHAKLAWARQDRQPLPHDIVDRDGFLKLSQTTMQDAGAYICTATDPRTNTPQQAPPARLNVRPEEPAPEAPASPMVDPPEQTVDEGSPATVRCWVPGQPNAQIRWLKGTRDPLPREASEQGGVLTIHSTTQADAGQYTCIAYDPTGRSPQQVPARINVRPGAGPAIKVEVDPSEQTVPEGTPFNIRCWVPGHPHMQLQWKKVDGELPMDAREQSGSLRVQQSLLSDAGDYVCTATNPADGSPIDSEPATVHVTPKHIAPLLEGGDDAAPEVFPPHQSVPENDPATIRCWVPEKPDAKLSFKRRDGNPIPIGASDDNGVLTIHEAKTADAGDYICTYHPTHGGAPKHSSPSVLEVTSEGAPPRPVATPPVITVQTGEPARFRCDAHSDTPATITWGYQDADSPLRGDVVQEGDDLIVNSATDEIAGEYVCSATNDFGTGVAEPVKLVVTDTEAPPTARVEPRVWNGKPGDRHQFKCIVTGVPTPAVTWTGPDGSPLAHDVTELENNILDFAEGRSELNGDYTCTAKNSVGEASDHGVVNIGQSLTVKTTPAGPRIVLTVGEPLEVKCEAFGDPDPEVEWLHDPGPERGDLPDDFKPVTISEQFIKHPAIGLGNAGQYTCKGSNSHATATKNIYIEVVEPSKIATVSVLGGSSQWFDLGEPGELTCTATGSSLVDRLEWVKVDDQLPSDVEEHNEPGVLHFPSFKSSYSGEYECRGYRNEEQIASARVHVYGSDEDNDDARVEIDPPRVRVVSQGDSIVLQCSVEGAKNGENFEWALLRGGSVIRKLGNEPKLTIKKADPTNDFGVYRCNVEDDNGNVVGSAFAAVTVGYENSQNAQEVKFDEKSDASFTCPVYSVPGSKVDWSRRDGELPANAVPNGNKLEIKEFDDSTTGLYVCKVNIDNNVVEGYVDAKIFVPDTIIQVLLEVSSESVSIGDRAWFDCKVTGDSSAVITWSREGADSLPESAQVTGSRLQFTDLKEEDGGVYKCRAKTKAGPLETRSVLNIGAKRKRKHAQRRGRHNRRSHTRRALAARAEKKTHSLFGSWFSTN